MKKIRSKPIILIWIIVVLAIFGYFAKKYYDNQQLLPFSEKHTIIFDTDMGADDAMALLLVAKAPNISLVGVTTLSGNVSLEQCGKNALTTLEVAGHPDVKVYPGSTTRVSGKAIEPYSVFGKDGLGDRNLVHPRGKIEDKNAIDFILETVAANPGKIEIVSVGPMTNIAKAIRKNPKIMSRTKRIWSLGTGGTKIIGNASPVAEFNAYQDAPAYKIVADSKIPMTIVGLDICQKEDFLVTEKLTEEWRKFGKCGNFLAESQKGILAYYKKIGQDTVNICDPIAAAALIWKGFITEAKLCHLEVVTDHKLWNGAVVFFEKGSKYDKLNMEGFHVNVVTDVNSECYFEAVKSLLSSK